MSGLIQQKGHIRIGWIAKCYRIYTELKPAQPATGRDAQRPARPTAATLAKEIMLYIYCNTSGFDILNKSRLRLSRLESVNDPFELLIAIDEDNAFNNIQNEFDEDPAIISKWKQLLIDQKIEIESDRQEDILKAFVAFQISSISNAVNKLWDHWNNSMGIICFSEAMDVIQMWAHYADGHKGIVVGLDENVFISDKEEMITVCYRDKIVLFPITGIKEKFDSYVKKYIPEVIGRKETHWNYEKEVRLYGTLDQKDQDGFYYMEVPRISIKELYLGLKSDASSEMLAVCLKKRDEYKHLSVFKMTKAKNAFKLIPKEVKV